MPLFAPLPRGTSGARIIRVFEDSGSARRSGEDLVGTIGRVTVAIPEGHPGEVLVPVRGGTEAFAAWSDEPIPKGVHVVVVECRSPRSVFVTPFPDGILLENEVP
jgi:membrane protein implicated in regulation of membrane protease activity